MYLIRLVLSSTRIFNVYIAFLTLIFFSLGTFGQRTFRYLESEAALANPERGWYDDYYSHSGSSMLGSIYTSLDVDELIRNREEDKITLILRLFYLHDFLEEENVSDQYLSLMQEDFEAIRSAGVKCIIRFAYSASGSAEVFDATPERVFSHIASLSEVLASNGDIIAGVQAGFVGAWGEWYYTENFAGDNFVPSDTDQDNRRLIFELLLDILPDHISVQGRTPAIMQNAVQSSDPINDQEAFTGTVKSRVGHHNDCFLANSSDYGTYTNLEEDLAYLHESTKYTITGGETCDASNSASNCDNSVPRMQLLHWTYLNRDYNRNVYQKWEDEGCYDEINLELGYRIRLDSSIFPESIDKGTVLNFKIHLFNRGYSAPTQYKPITLILEDVFTNEEYELSYVGTNDDIRYWLPGEIILEASVPTSVNIPDSEYRLYIQLSDQSSSIRNNPAYSIQFANVGTWDSEKGINDLNHIISVGTPVNDALSLGKPLELVASVRDRTSVELMWKDMSMNESGFQIMREELGRAEGYIVIDTVDSNIERCQDDNVVGGITYNYVIRAFNDNLNSEWSNSSSVTIARASNIESISQGGFLMFPNPLVGDDLIIHFNDNSLREVVILNISGQIVFRSESNLEELVIECSEFPQGIYTARVMRGDGAVSVQKLIVLK